MKVDEQKSFGDFMITERHLKRSDRGGWELSDSSLAVCCLS